MMGDEKQVSALIRRHEQVKRWEDSDTNLEPVTHRRDKVKVKFQDGCVFLAACSSGDKEEVKRLLERGADINTANVDGLTALHQACIDDNLEMVEFLVEMGADVDVCDNEGWTPLHATSSCAFTEIARYLIKNGANVAAVNNDGDLPMDIAENDEMENLLQEEMDKQGIDAEAARCEEEERMLDDAKTWLQDKSIQEIKHPKTGATALHVAAAKGYIKVMNLLLEAGVDVNAEDGDGWTPLHAAAHWGQEEACKILVENMCDMMYKNKAGHTAFDLAENDMLKLLEELKEKQATLRNKEEIDTDIILPSGHGGKRRSSVTRMSVDQKQNVIQRSAEEERAGLLPAMKDDKIINSISRVPEPLTIEDAETVRENEKNKKVSQQAQPTEPSPAIIAPTSASTVRPASVATSSPALDMKKSDMPKIDEVTESERPTSAPVGIPTTAIVTVSSTASISTSLPSTTQSDSGTEATVVLSPKPSVSIWKGDSKDADVQESAFGKGANVLNHSRDLVSRSISVPASLPTQKDTLSSTSTASSRTGTTSNSLSLPSWRQGLSKTSSSSMVSDWMSENDPSSLLPRSSSSPRLVLDSRLDSLQRLANRRPISSTGSTTASGLGTTTTETPDSKPADRNSYTMGQGYTGRSRFGNLHQFRQPRDIAAAENSGDKIRLSDSGRLRDRGPLSGTISAASVSSTPSLPTPAPTSSTTSTSTTNSVFRRSYEPPKRDEETETQRKARAKHARQTRRSTQGVSLEDIEKAEESLRSNDHSKVTKERGANTTTTVTSSLLPSSRNSVIDKETGVPSSSAGSISSTPAVTTTTSTNSDATQVGEDKSITSGYRWRSSVEDRNDSTKSDVPTRRRAKEERDLNSTSAISDVTSNYVPRSQRNSALVSSDISVSPSQNLLRTSSLRSSRHRNGDTIESGTQKTEEDAKKEEGTNEKREPLRSRRRRTERRQTGIEKEEDKDKESSKDKSEEEEREDNLVPYTRQSSRYSSNSDAPSSERSQRPVSYTEFSRSTTSLDIDYKKKYEDEKSENEKLRKELEETKKNLLEAKKELDKAMKQRDATRTTDRDKRALERKVSEMEEELKKMEALKQDNQRLKDENGALIRVISKLSK